MTNYSFFMFLLFLFFSISLCIYLFIYFFFIFCPLLNFRLKWFGNTSQILYHEQKEADTIIKSIIFYLES